MPEHQEIIDLPNGWRHDLSSKKLGHRGQLRQRKGQKQRASGAPLIYTFSVIHITIQCWAKHPKIVFAQNGFLSNSRKEIFVHFPPEKAKSKLNFIKIWQIFHRFSPQAPLNSLECCRNSFRASECSIDKVQRCTHTFCCQFFCVICVFSYEMYLLS